MSEAYDSRSDTSAHIRRVQDLLNLCASELRRRGTVHDASKLVYPEKEAFDRGTPALKGLEYGSAEYRESFAKHGMKDAVAHHYAVNSHHPEHYALGVSGMSLFDVIEMLMDWKAASERHATGDILKSLEINKERFHLSEQMYSVLLATVSEMGWT